MSDAQNTTVNPKLTEAISYFEEILQLMPNDRPALEFLAVAYEQKGDLPKRSQTVTRLTDVLISENDLECLKNLRPTLEEINTPEAQGALLKIEAAIRKAAFQAQPENDTAKAPQTDLQPAISAELHLLQHLQLHKIIGEGTAKVVEEQLREIPSRTDAVRISALALIRNENVAECETALAYLADAFHLPPIPLAPALATGTAPAPLPEAFARRGARPFAELGDTLLVAILNPMDDDLRKAITAAAGKPCQFFLADPGETEGAAK